MATSIDTAPPRAGDAAPTRGPALRRWASSAAGWLLLPLSLVLGVLPMAPPNPVGVDAPAAEFSAQRAMTHLANIAQRPHPTGSADAARIRDFLQLTLAGMGLRTDIQRAAAIHEKQPTHFHAGVVENVAGRLKGTGDGQAIMLSAHYDSVGAGPGANDDGVAVAALLEAVRVLKAGPPLRHDVIVLLTDGEEFGLLGSHAFVDHHPWAKDVRMVFNFEARGNSGPSIMFQTSPGNADLIAGLASVPNSVGSSISQPVYEALPNDTDFTVFSAAGLRGMNFAFVGGQIHYHNASDSIANVDPSTIQHHGEYAVGLTRYFDQRDLTKLDTSEAVYFNLAGALMVRYPAWLTVPLAVLALLVLVAAMVIGVRRARLSVGRSIAGLGLVFAGVAMSGVVTAAIWWAIEQANPGFLSFAGGDVYNSEIYLAAFGCLTIAMSTLWWRLWQRRLGLDNLFMGAALWWALLLVLVTVVVPPAAYLFTWPLLAAGGGLLYRAIRGRADERPARQLIAYLPAAVIAILLLAPVLYLLLLVVGPALAAVGMVVGATVGALVFPLLRLDRPVLGRWLPLTAAFAAAALFVATVPTGGYSKEQPLPDNVFYALDADTGSAIWGALGESPESWISDHAGQDHDARMPEFFRMPLNLHVGPAPTAALAAPQATIVSNTVTAGVRTVTLILKSGRGAPMVEIVSLSDARVRAATVDGKRVLNTHPSDPYGFRWSLHYIAPPPAGVEVTIEVESAAPFPVRLLDRSYRIDEIPELHGIANRPADTMPGNEDGDFVAVSRGMVIN